MSGGAASELRSSVVRTLAISLIRRDGGTQHRISSDPAVIADYRELMLEGVTFPPVRVWWDGVDYWLADGFQRCEAALEAGILEILCEIRNGSQAEARWDSYSANATHGRRRTREEAQRVVRLALQHPNSSQLSNMEIRLVKRGKTTYALNTANLGNSRQRHAKSRVELRSELGAMKENATPAVRRLLAILEHWVFGSATPTECLEAMKRVLESGRS